jgi:hypothetical protein
LALISGVSACNEKPNAGAAPAPPARLDAGSARVDAAREAPAPPVASAELDAATGAAASTVSSPDASDGAVAFSFTDKDPWVVNCVKRSVELHCGTIESCRSLCGQMRGARFCKRQVNAFMACLMKTERNQWYCDDNYEPSLVASACLPERGPLTDCLMHSDGKL